ncbi:hypothetical protein CRUP_010892, partial [Coryphaenoides rupestris]
SNIEPAAATPPPPPPPPPRQQEGVESRRYDSRTTIFSPEGRLYQVEYAMEAIGHAGTCLGILANDGVLLAAERRNIHKLLDEVFFSEKIYKLNEDIACSVAGITSDANVLTNELRLIAQRYLLQYQEPMPCEQLVTALCDIKQAYTHGNYGGWKATCIGNNSASAVSMLKQDFKEGEMTLSSALALAVKVLNKTMDSAVSMLKQDFKEGEMTLSSALALAVKVLNKTMDVSKLSAEK